MNYFKREDLIQLEAFNMLCGKQIGIGEQYQKMILKKKKKKQYGICRMKLKNVKIYREKRLTTQ